MSKSVYVCDGCEHRCRLYNGEVEPFMCVIGLEDDAGNDIANWNFKEE